MTLRPFLFLIIADAFVEAKILSVSLPHVSTSAIAPIANYLTVRKNDSNIHASLPLSSSSSPSSSNDNSPKKKIDTIILDRSRILSKSNDSSRIISKSKFETLDANSNETIARGNAHDAPRLPLISIGAEHHHVLPYWIDAVFNRGAIDLNRNIDEEKYENGFHGNGTDSNTESDYVGTTMIHIDSHADLAMPNQEDEDSPFFDDKVFDGKVWDEMGMWKAVGITEKENGNGGAHATDIPSGLHATPPSRLKSINYHNLYHKSPRSIEKQIDIADFLLASIHIGTMDHLVMIDPPWAQQFRCCFNDPRRLRHIPMLIGRDVTRKGAPIRLWLDYERYEGYEDWHGWKDDAPPIAELTPSELTHVFDVTNYKADTSDDDEDEDGARDDWKVWAAKKSYLVDVKRFSLSVVPLEEIGILGDVIREHEERERWRRGREKWRKSVERKEAKEENITQKENSIQRNASIQGSRNLTKQTKRNIILDIDEDFFSSHHPDAAQLQTFLPDDHIAAMWHWLGENEPVSVESLRALYQGLQTYNYQQSTSEPNKTTDMKTIARKVGERYFGLGGSSPVSETAENAAESEWAEWMGFFSSDGSGGQDNQSSKNSTNFSEKDDQKHLAKTNQHKSAKRAAIARKRTALAIKKVCKSVKDSLDMCDDNTLPHYLRIFSAENRKALEWVMGSGNTNSSKGNDNKRKDIKKNDNKENNFYTAIEHLGEQPFFLPSKQVFDYLFEVIRKNVFDLIIQDEAKLNLNLALVSIARSPEFVPVHIQSVLECRLLGELKGALKTKEAQPDLSIEIDERVQSIGLVAGSVRREYIFDANRAASGSGGDSRNIEDTRGIGAGPPPHAPHNITCTSPSARQDILNTCDALDTSLTTLPFPDVRSLLPSDREMNISFSGPNSFFLNNPEVDLRKCNADSLGVREVFNGFPFVDEFEGTGGKGNTNNSGSRTSDDKSGGDADEDDKSGGDGNYDAEKSAGEDDETGASVDEDDDDNDNDDDTDETDADDDTDEASDAVSVDDDDKDDDDTDESADGDEDNGEL